MEASESVSRAGRGVEGGSHSAIDFWGVVWERGLCGALEGWEPQAAFGGWTCVKPCEGAEALGATLLSGLAGQF